MAQFVQICVGIKKPTKEEQLNIYNKAKKGKTFINFFSRPKKNLFLNCKNHHQRHHITQFIVKCHDCITLIKVGNDLESDFGQVVPKIYIFIFICVIVSFLFVIILILTLIIIIMVIGQVVPEITF